MSGTADRRRDQRDHERDAGRDARRAAASDRAARAGRRRRGRGAPRRDTEARIGATIPAAIPPIAPPSATCSEYPVRHARCRVAPPRDGRGARARRPPASARARRSTATTGRLDDTERPERNEQRRAGPTRSAPSHARPASRAGRRGSVVARYTVSGAIHRNGTAAMSVEMSVVTPISSAAGTAARTTHGPATRDGASASTTGGSADDPRYGPGPALRPPRRTTTSAAPTVARAKTANPIDHQRRLVGQVEVWLDQRRVGDQADEAPRVRGREQAIRLVDHRATPRTSAGSSGWRSTARRTADPTIAREDEEQPQRSRRAARAAARTPARRGAQRSRTSDDDDQAATCSQACRRRPEHARASRAPTRSPPAASTGRTPAPSSRPRSSRRTSAAANRATSGSTRKARAAATNATGDEERGLRRGRPPGPTPRSPTRAAPS